MQDKWALEDGLCCRTASQARNDNLPASAAIISIANPIVAAWRGRAARGSCTSFAV